MFSDIEIAQNCKMLPITEVAKSLDSPADELECYGKYKAKISESFLKSVQSRPQGRLILVTAINPTPAGEGKTTTSVGLGQAMAKLGKKAIVALREPSMGPVFGIKGGAAGGGYSQVVPMEDINLHFTGDMHAITAANNLLCAMLDNHIQQGNELGIDGRTVTFKRCLDMNDRNLRRVMVGMGGKANGVPREDGFIITVASEVMAILCLARDLSDLKERLGRILVARNFKGEPVFAKDLGAVGAMAALLADAIKPNLVQTLEGSPAIMHGGPFANIAHGCNSLRATRLALHLADYCITEAGFGSDLGAEKFFDIKCRAGGLTPCAAVLVATVRALKYNGGVPKAELSKPNEEALRAGIVNLGAHIKNLQQFGIPVVVAINHFDTDTEGELDIIKNYCTDMGTSFALSEVFGKGGEGGIELAKRVCEAAGQSSDFRPLYPLDLSLKEKIEIIARKVYGADGVEYSAAAEKNIKEIGSLADGLPVCMAKTQYSLSDNPSLLGRPTGFVIHVDTVTLSGGAGFVVVHTGNIMTMPGLPKQPSAVRIDISDDGKIQGLF